VNRISVHLADISPERYVVDVLHEDHGDETAVEIGAGPTRRKAIAAAVDELDRVKAVLVANFGESKS